MTKDKTIERFIENIFQDSVEQISSFGGYISIWYNGERVFDYPLNDLYEWDVRDHFVELIKEYFPVDNDEELIARLIRGSKSTNIKYSCDEIEAESSEWREILILLLEKYDKK